MFTDGRSRRVVFLAHCLLNQNAISDGTAVYPAAFRELVQFFLEHQVGIVQLPCPASHLGEPPQCVLAWY